MVNVASKTILLALALSAIHAVQGGDPGAKPTPSTQPPTTPQGGTPPTTQPPTTPPPPAGGTPTTQPPAPPTTQPPQQGGSNPPTQPPPGPPPGPPASVAPPTSPPPGTTTCPVINTCMGTSTAANRLTRNRKRDDVDPDDFLGEGRVDPTTAQCYINQFRTPNNCFNVPNDYDRKWQYARSFQCVQDANGHYVCFRGYSRSNLRMSNCQLTLPNTITNFEVTFFTDKNENTGRNERGGNIPCATRFCTIAGGVASCPISPLILDMNHDGHVSAQVGIGIDLNGNGVPDGAAIDGDKMLAMSDLNGNKEIDGAEVFGDMTVSPFTKKKLKVPNGFEALRAIAKEASALDKTSYIQNDRVDMVALAKSLKKRSVTLGFVSGKNNKRVEPLKDVKSISLQYRELKKEEEEQEAKQQGKRKKQGEEGASHKQKGSFEDASGKWHPVDDVWFVEK